MNAPGTTYSLPIGNRNAFTSHGIDGIVDYLRSLGYEEDVTGISTVSDIVWSTGLLVFQDDAF